MSFTAQELFEKAFQDNQGVVEFSQVAAAIKDAGNIDTTVIWRMWHNKRSFYIRGNYLVSRFISKAQADEIINERCKHVTGEILEVVPKGPRFKASRTSRNRQEWPDHIPGIYPGK